MAVVATEPQQLKGPPPPGRPQHPPGAGGKRYKKPVTWLPYALIAPAIVFELVVHIIPMLAGLWASIRQLTKYTIANWATAPFAGLDNYVLAVNPALLRSLLITAGFTLLVVGLSWALGMAAAIALQKTFRGRGLLRMLFLVPYALPVYAGVIAWKFMFQKDTGALNFLLVDQLHLLPDAPFWLIGDNAFVSLVIVGVWGLWPFAFLMLMAGLQSVPTEVYEASAIDGARPLKQWLHITLPMLRPVNVVLVLVMFLWTFNNFNIPFVLFGGSQPPAGDLITFRIYNASFLTWNFGLGAAMSVLLLVLLLFITAIYFVVVNRKGRNA